jgi:hypothetical protein
MAQPKKKSSMTLKQRAAFTAVGDATVNGGWYRAGTRSGRHPRAEAVSLASLHRVGALERRPWRGKEGDRDAAYEYRLAESLRDAFQTSRRVAFVGVLTHYLGAAGERAHAHYERLHFSATDSPIDLAAAVIKAAQTLGATDGDELEVIVRRTGRRPFGDRRVRFVGPSAYRREPE